MENKNPRGKRDDEYGNSETKESAARQGRVKGCHLRCKGGLARRELDDEVDAQCYLHCEHCRGARKKRDKGRVIGGANARVQPHTVVVKAVDASAH